MGRCRRTEDEGEDEDGESSRPSWSHSQLKKKKKKKKKKELQFFNIIHSGILRDQKLELPSRFVRKFGNHLSDVAVLKVPNDQVWKVELEKSDKSIWFHNGWQKFVEYHSIREGHFLVFKYVEGSCFDVLIFDTSCAEIEYPCDAHNAEDSNNGGECPMNIETEETGENDPVVFLDGHDETIAQTKKRVFRCA